MRIIGIDPGYERLGLAVIERNGGSDNRLLYSTCLTTSKTYSFHERLKLLADAIEKKLKKYRPDTLAVEEVFFSGNQKTAMRVSEIRGMILYLGTRAGINIINLTPLQVKTAVTGYGQAGKDQVKNMVERLLALKPGGRQDDEIDALAIALTGLARANQVYPQRRAPTIAKKTRG